MKFYFNVVLHVNKKFNILHYFLVRPCLSIRVTDSIMSNADIGSTTKAGCMCLKILVSNFHFRKACFDLKLPN
jgi:hypothetical protein